MSLSERVGTLPTSAGVYLFKDERSRVLYVGKAQNLRNRVRSYLSEGGDGRVGISRLVERAHDVDVVVTPNVKDALLLENELIKQHKPVFNVRLRDDKQYLGLRLDPRETWPRITQVRRFGDDGALYFGPYTSSASMREALSNLRRLFPLRSCSDPVFRDYARRGRPCIEYEMKRCLAPCCDRVDAESYAALVRGTELFLRGRSDELRAEIETRMHAAAERERFEEAARLRDRLAAIDRTLERQQIVSERPIDRDVFGLARDGGEVEVEVLHVRGGRVIGAAEYGFSDVRIDDGEVVTSFLGQFYAGDAERDVPREILTPSPLADDGALEALLADRAPGRVSLRTPMRGRLRRLVEMANANAELGLRQRLDARESVERTLRELEERLSLSCLPRRIECYDVSTLQGSFTVASRVCFVDGRPLKADYRRYRIREARGGDDYASLREVIERRLERRESEPLPDLLVVDGGKGQLGVMTAALRDAGVEAEALGIAKERDDRSASLRVRRSGGLKAERVFRPGRKDAVLLPPSSTGLLLLQRIRDESHRFAIEYQRSLRRRIGMTSILEALPGIGPGKRRALLRHLGSLAAVRGSEEEALAAVPGVSARDAAVIRRFFDAQAGGEAELDAPAAEETAASDTDAQASGRHAAGAIEGEG